MGWLDWFGSSSSSGEQIGQNRDGSPIYATGSGSSSTSAPSSGSGYDWLTWDNLGKAVNAGRQIYNAFDMNDARQDSRNNMLDLFGKIGQQDDAYAKQMQDWQMANAASRAAAARANDAARRKSAAKTAKVQKKMLKQMMAQYQPYADATKMLTPKMAQNYGQFLDTTALLNQYLTPRAMQTLGEAPKATASFNTPQPTFTGGAPVNVPSVEEILGWKK